MRFSDIDQIIQSHVASELIDSELTPGVSDSTVHVLGGSTAFLPSSPEARGTVLSR